jgi:hypothetical protein
VRIERPAEYVKIVAGLMPKEFTIEDNRLADLTDDELETFIVKLRTQLKSNFIEDAGSGEKPTLN